MNQFPSVSPTPAPAAQQPRPPVQRNRRAGNKRRRKSAPLPLWQGLILLALAVGVALAAWSLNRAESTLQALRDDRERARLQYENEVARHQVKYRDLIEYYAAANQIDPAYVAAVIKRESDYDPDAVSRVDARGLMQIMPDTGEWLAGKVDQYDYQWDMLFEPEVSIKMGCWYLGYLSRLFDGDPILVACAYHAGQGNVRSWLEKYSADGKSLSLEQIPMDDSRYYAGKVLNAYAIYQQHYY